MIVSQRGVFQFMLILDQWGISFHPVVVDGLGNDLLFNFTVGHCGVGGQKMLLFVHVKGKKCPGLCLSQKLKIS